MPRQSTKRPPTLSRATRYEDDLYSWVQEQVALLRAGRMSEIDALNVAEELADVGKTELYTLESAIAVLTHHLLKWDHQSKRRSRSRELSVREQRDRIADVLEDNPGLKPRLSKAMARGYKYGRVRALDETKLPDDALPASCPYSFDEMMTRPIVYVPPPVRKRKARREK